jgi:CrcB protein
VSAWAAALLVGLGGALGSNARYWLGHWFKAQPWAQDYFWGTFVINVSGSVLLGLVAALFRDRVGAGFLLLGTGFCGGYTTFSTFSLEVVEFLQRGRWDLALLYAGTSVLAGFAGFAAVFLLVRGEAA